MILYLAITISAILYRWPRGGLPFGWGITSTVASMIWAVGSAGLIGAAVGAPMYWVGAAMLYLWLAEKPGWSDWWPNDGDATDDPDDILKLTLRGLLLLNPFMGLYEHALFYNKHRLPLNNAFFDGWHGWAEILSGATTAVVLAAILKFAPGIF